VTSTKTLVDECSTLDGGPAPAETDRACLPCPDGLGPRPFFQEVPEGKRLNRVHLDLHVGQGRVVAGADRLESIGARRLWFSDDRGGSRRTMDDPEGKDRPRSLPLSDLGEDHLAVQAVPARR